MLPGVYSNQAPGATHMGYSQVPQQQPERGYGSVLTAPKGGDLTRVSPWLAAHATIASQIPITGYSGTYTSAETLSAIFKCIYSGSLPSQFPELHDQLSRYATVRLGLYADSSNAIPPVSIDEEDYLYGRNTNKNSTLLDRQKKWLLSLCWSNREISIVPIQNGFSYFVEDANRVADYIIALSYEWKSYNQNADCLDITKATITGTWYKRTDDNVIYRMTGHKSHAFVVNSSKWRLGGSGFPGTDTDTRGIVSFSVSNPPTFIKEYKARVNTPENQLYVTHLWDGDTKVWKYLGAFLAPDDIISLVDIPWASSAKQADKLYIESMRAGKETNSSSASQPHTPSVDTPVNSAPTHYSSPPVGMPGHYHMSNIGTPLQYSNLAVGTPTHILQNGSQHQQVYGMIPGQPQAVPIHPYHQHQQYPTPPMMQQQFMNNNRTIHAPYVSTAANPSLYVPILEVTKATPQNSITMDMSFMSRQQYKSSEEQQNLLRLRGGCSDSTDKSKKSKKKDKKDVHAPSDIDESESCYDDTDVIGEEGEGEEEEEEDDNAETEEEEEGYLSEDEFEPNDQQKGTINNENFQNISGESGFSDTRYGKEEESDETDDDEYYNRYDEELAKESGEEERNEVSSVTPWKQQPGENPDSKHGSATKGSEKQDEDDDNYYNLYENVHTAIQGDDGRGAAGLPDSTALAAAMFAGPASYDLVQQIKPVPFNNEEAQVYMQENHNRAPNYFDHDKAVSDVDTDPNVPRAAACHQDTEVINVMSALGKYQPFRGVDENIEPTGGNSDKQGLKIFGNADGKGSSVLQQIINPRSTSGSSIQKQDLMASSVPNDGEKAIKNDDSQNGLSLESSTVPTAQEPNQKPIQENTTANEASISSNLGANSHSGLLPVETFRNRQQGGFVQNSNACDIELLKPAENERDILQRFSQLNEKLHDIASSNATPSSFSTDSMVSASEGLNSNGDKPRLKGIDYSEIPGSFPSPRKHKNEPTEGGHGNTNIYANNKMTNSVGQDNLESQVDRKSIQKKPEASNTQSRAEKAVINTERHQQETLGLLHEPISGASATNHMHPVIESHVKTTLTSLYSLAKSQGISLTEFITLAYEAASESDKK